MLLKQLDAKFDQTVSNVGLKVKLVFLFLLVLTLK